MRPPLVALPCPADFRTHDGDEFTLGDLLWGPGYLDRSSFAIRERIGFLWIWLRGKN